MDIKKEREEWRKYLETFLFHNFFGFIAHFDWANTPISMKDDPNTDTEFRLLAGYPRFEERKAMPKNLLFLGRL